MVCYKPLQVSFSVRSDGKKKLNFSDSLPAMYFAEGRDITKVYDVDVLSLPCGKCIGCRLERSRQWAMRCMHEASLYEDNCFITLTYDPEFLPVDGSLDKTHFQLFMKRLRRVFSDSKIRYYQCGEYGDTFSRPHYHACIFGFDFPDKEYWKSVNDFPLYTSKVLESLWGLGFCSIGNLSYESAAYVARYCTKKVTGKRADSYYQGRQPEYSTMSLKPGIGAGWYDRWKTDCFPSDYLIVDGVKCKPPRFYDKKLEREDPALFEQIKQSRIENAKDDDDNSYRRLLVREKCQEARFKKLIRTIERK